MNDKVKTALGMVAESRPKINLNTALERADLEAQARADIENIRASLLSILDDVDYTVGNCRPNDMVGAALDRVIIANARKVLNA